MLTYVYGIFDIHIIYDMINFLEKFSWLHSSCLFMCMNQRDHVYIGTLEVCMSVCLSVPHIENVSPIWWPIEIFKQKNLTSLNTCIVIYTSSNRMSVLISILGLKFISNPCNLRVSLHEFQPHKVKFPNFAGNFAEGD